LSYLELNFGVSTNSVEGALIPDSRALLKVPSLLYEAYNL